MRPTRAALVIAASLLTAAAPQPAGAATHGRWWRPAVARGAEYHLRTTQSGGPADIAFTYGRASDVHLLGDWDGNGTRTPGVVRAVNGQFVWLLRNHLGGGAAEIEFAFGRATTTECVDDPPQCVDLRNTPLVGDWDGNGTETPGLVAPWKGTSTFYVRNSLSGGRADRSCLKNDESPWVVGDWDGDGVDVPASALGGVWRLYRDLCDKQPYARFGYGRAADVPIAGDWDRDGRSEPGVVRRLPDDDNRLWLLRDTADAGAADRSFVYGRTGDVPLVW